MQAKLDNIPEYPLTGHHYKGIFLVLPPNIPLWKRLTETEKTQTYYAAAITAIRSFIKQSPVNECLFLNWYVYA
jgi:hypothetical protein